MGNNKYINNNRDLKEGTDGKGDQDGKESVYRKSPPQLRGLCNKGDSLGRHATSPPNASKSTSPLPPEPTTPRTLSATANRTALLPSIAAVLDSEGLPSALENKAWNSSSESYLAPSSSLSHVRLLKSRNTKGGPEYDEHEEEEETDSTSGSDSGDCTRETTGTEVEFPCPSLTEGIGENATSTSCTV